MQDLLSYIDQHADQFVERLRTLCRQPSIAAQSVGMSETADMVAALLGQVGADAQVLPTQGFPVVYGAIPGRSAKTLSFYDHYDVQPPEPLELWDSDPFAAEVRDGKLKGVGALIGQAKKENPNVNPNRVRELCLKMIQRDEG